MREALRKERTDRKLSQEKLAEKLGLATITVRKIEKGQRNPNSVTAGKFSMFYNKNVEELFPDIFLSINDTKCIGKLEIKKEKVVS